jgi:hypothetical protein
MWHSLTGRGFWMLENVRNRNARLQGVRLRLPAPSAVRLNGSEHRAEMLTYAELGERLKRSCRP